MWTQGQGFDEAPIGFGPLARAGTSTTTSGRCLDRHLPRALDRRTILPFRVAMCFEGYRADIDPQLLPKSVKLTA